MLFSAELVLEEKIEYNDLVNSIQNGNSSDDEPSNLQSEKQIDAAPKNGNFNLMLSHTHARCNAKPTLYCAFKKLLLHVYYLTE